MWVTESGGSRPRSSSTRATGSGRPSRDELRTAYGDTIDDVLAPELDVLFCGINPSLYSGWTGWHFARPGNRFWPALPLAGFTDRRLFPAEQRELLDFRLGLTNIVARATARADELSAEELRAGATQLDRKVRTYRPRWLAIVGVTAYRTAFERPRTSIGPQSDTIGTTRIWVLPNPSGLNAHYTVETLANEYRRLYDAIHSPEIRSNQQ